MSETSKKLLKSNHDGVHLQLDMLIASMKFQEECFIGMYDDWYEKSSKQKDILIKNRLNENLILMNHNPGMVEKNLVVYVFQFYEKFYDGFVNFNNIENNIPLRDVQNIIVILAGRFLDNQFENQGRADIVSFLKQDVTQLESAKTQNRKILGVEEKEFNWAGLIFLIIMIPVFYILLFR
jgi:hypothetical protein